MCDLGNPWHWVDPFLDDAKNVWNDMTGATARKEAEKNAKKQAAEALRIQRQAASNAADDETRRRAKVLAGLDRAGRGRASTLLTGSQGVQGQAPTASTTLLGS